MERIALIIGETFVYWHSIVLTLAVAASVCLFLAFWLGQGGSWTEGLCAAALSCVASLVLGRLAHWYFQSASYPSFYAAMTDYTTGSFALMGVFAGCVLTAGLLRLLGLCRQMPAMLDCMALAGAAGIAVGRLACLYTDADRGMVLENITQLPLAYPVLDPVSGQQVYRLATFMLQAICAGVLFVALTGAWLLRHRKPGYRKGDTALLFLLLHGAVEMVADSTRYDSLFMRSNGFVGVVQILGLLTCLVAVVIFSVYLVRARGYRKWYPALWAGILAALGLAGYMEYYVQRHGDQAAMAYGVMSVGVGAAVGITLAIYILSVDKTGK